MKISKEISARSQSFLSKERKFTLFSEILIKILPPIPRAKRNLTVSEDGRFFSNNWLGNLFSSQLIYNA